MEAVILTAHIGGGVLGLLTGVLALFSRKGAGVHVIAGLVFAVVMPINGATAATLGVLQSSVEDVFGGLTTVYLVLTGWLTVRRKPRRLGVGEIIACLAALGAAGFILLSPQIAGVLGDPEKILTPADYVAAAFYGLLGAGDVSVIVRRGLAGRQRLARHLWRMHLGFFIAVGSFFPGQIQIFPRFIREIEPVALLFIPCLLVFVLMFFWLGRTLLARGGFRRPDAAAPS